MIYIYIYINDEFGNGLYASDGDVSWMAYYCFTHITLNSCDQGSNALAKNYGFVFSWVGSKPHPFCFRIDGRIWYIRVGDLEIDEFILAWLEIPWG